MEDKIEEKIEEAKGKAKSTQPRFNATKDTNDLFMQFVNIVEDEELREPTYSPDSRKRDEWLLNFVSKEPHLQGVINSVTSIDKNRGWSVIGGRNQVNRITQMLHSFNAAPGLSGWRPGFGSSSASFWQTDMGAVVELGRDGKRGPVRGLFHVDPTKCVLSGNPQYPLKYYPSAYGKVGRWTTDQFFRVTSSPDIREKYNGLGKCAVSRCIELAMLTVALYRHDEEKLALRAPHAMLLLSGIKQQQFKDALNAHKAEMDAEQMKYYGALMVLASAAQHTDGKLISMSETPSGFSLREWMDMIMFGYALCFGYDASEFWPVQYGALGRGNETQIQHEKATGKGRLEFVLGWQEQFQNYLPDSIEFEFDQRDEQGDLVHAQVKKAWADELAVMMKASQYNEALITRDEARFLASEVELISSTWAPTDEVAATDQNEDDKDPTIEDSSFSTSVEPIAQSTIAKFKDEKFIKRLRQQKLDTKPSIHVAAHLFQNEQIVEYIYPANTTIVLWDKGSDVFNQELYSCYKFPRMEEMKEMSRARGEGDINVTVNIPERAPEPRRQSSEGGFTVPEISISPVIKMADQLPPTVQVDVHIPEQPTPIVNINVPEQPAPIINNEINVPEQSAPIVNNEINIPEQPAPEIIVNVPESLAPIVNINPEIIVEMPAEKKKTISVERDEEGKITKLKEQSK
jgi:hypothetical protein